MALAIFDTIPGRCALARCLLRLLLLLVFGRVQLKKENVKDLTVRPLICHMLTTARVSA